MSKIASLQNALNSSSGRAATALSATRTHAMEAVPRSASVNSRAGKENIAAWLPSDFKRSIRLVQAKKPGDPSLQDLMAEAFNDLFIKYNVPTVSGE